MGVIKNIKHLNITEAFYEYLEKEVRRSEDITIINHYILLPSL